MKPFIQNISLCLSLTLLASCANSNRLLTNTLSGAGGALLAHELSDGNAGWTAAGAAAGVLTNEGIQHFNDKKTKKAYDTGYDKGRSDAVKQQYWLMVNAHSQEDSLADFTFYNIPVPAHEAAGASLLPSIQTLRIQD